MFTSLKNSGNSISPSDKGNCFLVFARSFLGSFPSDSRLSFSVFSINALRWPYEEMSLYMLVLKSGSTKHEVSCQPGELNGEGLREEESSHTNRNMQVRTMLPKR